MPSHAKKTSHKKLTRYQHRIKIIENQLHRDGFFQEKSLTAIFAIVVEGLNDAGLNVADRHKLILMKFINESKCHHYSLKKQLSEKVLSYLLQQFNEDKLTEAYLRGLFSYIDENGLTLGHRLMRHGD